MSHRLATIEPPREGHQRDAPPCDGDGGSATIWAAGASAALCALLTVVIAVAAATVTRHRATAAADLAALGAAAHVSHGEDAACEKARWVAGRMLVRLRYCRVTGSTAAVAVTADPGGLLGMFGAATAHARAGPVAGLAGTRGTVDSTRRAGGTPAGLHVARRKVRRRAVRPAVHGEDVRRSVTTGCRLRAVRYR